MADLIKLAKRSTRNTKYPGIRKEREKKVREVKKEGYFYIDEYYCWMTGGCLYEKFYPSQQNIIY